MHFFFRSRRFKIISVICALLAIIIVICSLTGWTAPQTNILSAMLSPVQKFSTGIANSVNGFFGKLESGTEMQQKIDELEAQIAEKNYDLIDYNDLKRQNEFYKQFLEIKENNPSFKFTAATLVSRDTSNSYGTFTIDKGTLDGVSVYDPVIVSGGIVGYIIDAYSTQSTVVTILNPAINISVIDNRTRDSGVVSGDMTLAKQSYGKMSYVSKNNTMAAGDFVISSGAGGVFPKGQLVGTVKEIKASESDASCYAVIEPVVPIDSITDVMVVTDFDGKSSLEK